jgi:hypothetical protein
MSRLLGEQWKGDLESYKKDDLGEEVQQMTFELTALLLK